MLPSNVSIMWEQFSKLPKIEFEKAWDSEYILMRIEQDDTDGEWWFMNPLSRTPPEVAFIDSETFVEMQRQLPSLKVYPALETDLADLYTVNDHDFMLLKMAYQ